MYAESFAVTLSPWDKTTVVHVVSRIWCGTQRKIASARGEFMDAVMARRSLVVFARNDA
jgi:hypothetical protein